MRIMRLFVVLYLVFFVLGLKAQVRLSNMFTDNMVLQRNQPVKVWGWAGKRESIFVEFCGKQTKTQAAQDGKWTVTLGTFPAGGPFELSVNGKNSKVVVQNI